MSEILEFAVREELYRRSEAWNVYFEALFSKEAPTEESVAMLIDAVQTIELSWEVVQADIACLRQRRKIEQQKAKAEKQSQDGYQASVQSQAQVDAIEEDARAGYPNKTLDRDRITPTERYRRGQEDVRTGGFVIDQCDAQLRQLRIDNPRVFGVRPDPSLQPFQLPKK